MDELYRYSKDFREYIDKYCAAHRVTKEEAFTHSIVLAIAVVERTICQKKHEGGYYT